MEYLNKKINISETLLDKEETEKFINEYLEDKDTEAYRLDDGSIAYGGDIVIAGINDKYFKDEDAYGQYLTDYMGFSIFKLPHIRKEHI